MKVCTAVVVCLLLFVLPAGADLFQWTDANGVKHFSNDPPPVRKGVEQQSEIKHSSEQYEQWEEQRKNGQSEMLKNSRYEEETGGESTPTGESIAGQHKNVIMYATRRCKYCALARAFFKKHGIAYTEYNITADKKAHKRFKKLNGSGVPLIFVGDNRISGFNEPLLKKLLVN